MKLKNDLTRSFGRVASRALLVFVMATGAIMPTASVFAQQLPPPDTAAITVATQTQAPATAPVQMTVVQDLDGVVKEYPFVAPLQTTLKQFDAERKEALKGIDRANDFYPGSYLMGKYSDTTNGREFVFMNMWNSPNACSYEGCPLSVFMKDGKDFRLVLETITDGNVAIASTKSDMAITISRGPNGDVTLSYNAKSGQFEEPAVKTPAPAPGQVAPR